jgi:hypothetical protein
MSVAARNIFDDNALSLTKDMRTSMLWGGSCGIAVVGLILIIRQPERGSHLWENPQFYGHAIFFLKAPRFLWGGARVPINPTLPVVRVFGTNGNLN